MKKLARKLCLYLVPFVVLVLLFFVFEPYDYFLLREDAPYPTGPLQGMREVILTQPSRIILGDSQMANLNVDYIKEITGRDYTKMAFGGATLSESIALFWFAAEHTQLEEIVFGINFYTANGTYSPERIEPVAQAATSPLRYLGRFNYWLDTLNNVKRLGGDTAGRLFGRPDWITTLEDPTSFEPQHIPDAMGETYRADLEAYARNSIYPGCEDYAIDPATYAALDELVRYCKEQGITLTFVLPPVHVSVYTLVIEPLGLENDIAELKQFLTTRAPVIDMLFLGDFTCDDANFYDGFHLRSDNKRLLAQWIFCGVQNAAVVRYGA